MTHWATVAPINPYWRGFEFRVNQPVDLGNRVLLTPIPEWFKAETMTPYLVEAERQEYVRVASFAFWSEYEAASLGDTDPDASDGRPVSRQDSALERIRLANLALWLARPSGVGFKFSFEIERDQGEWIHRETSRHNNTLIPHVEDENNRLTQEDMVLARTLNEACASLKREGPVWTAVRVLWRALTEYWWEGRYVVLWIALEALFGPPDSGETTYRLCQRLAIFVAGKGEEGEKEFRRAKGGYIWRSRAVHGLRLKGLKQEESAELMHKAESFVRESLVKILSNADYVQKFSDAKLREAFLDGLLFGTTSGTGH